MQLYLLITGNIQKPLHMTYLVTFHVFDQSFFSLKVQVPSPTCADAPDDTRLEFKDFKKQAQSLASDAWAEAEWPNYSLLMLNLIPYEK